MADSNLIPMFCLAAKGFFQQQRKCLPIKSTVRVCEQGSHVQAWFVLARIVSEDEVAGCVIACRWLRRRCCFHGGENYLLFDPAASGIHTKTRITY